MLARWIAHLREQVEERLWRDLAGCLTPTHQTRLETLLVPAGEPRQTRWIACAALARLEKIRAPGV